MAQRNPSAITTDLAVDDPILQNADFAFDRDDRQYIDNQIRGMQQHLVEALIRGRLASYFLVDGSSDTLVAGRAVCLASVSSPIAQVTLAVLAALTTAIVTTGVVVYAAAPGSYALIAVGGALPPTLTNLAAGAPGFVRVNTTTGALERVETLDSADYGIGVVNNAGFMTVLPGVSAGGGGGGVALPRIEAFGGTTTLEDSDQHVAVYTFDIASATIVLPEEPTIGRRIEIVWADGSSGNGNVVTIDGGAIKIMEAFTLELPTWGSVILQYEGNTNGFDQWAIVASHGTFA